MKYVIKMLLVWKTIWDLIYYYMFFYKRSPYEWDVEIMIGNSEIHESII